MEIEILNQIINESTQGLMEPVIMIEWPSFRDIEQSKKCDEFMEKVKMIDDKKFVRKSNQFQTIEQKRQDEIKNKTIKIDETLSLDDRISQWVEKEGPAMLQKSMITLDVKFNKQSIQNFEKMNINQLQNEKKKVKNELKVYDTNFYSQFGRMPSRQEKEPMRLLYIFYKKIKQFIDKVPTPNSQNVVATKENKNNDIIIKLQFLKKKKIDIRQVLNDYQINFLKNNNRKIRYNKDLLPIKNEYQQYKDIKLEIEKLEKLLE